jgi:hypothetical protein
LGLYGSIPEDGAQLTVEWEDVRIEVQDVQEHQVSRAVVILPEPATEEEED